MSKRTAITTEEQLREAARQLLEADSVLRWRWKPRAPHREHGPPAAVELSSAAGRQVFEVKFKLSFTAHDLDRLAQGEGARRQLLIAPYLSDTLVRRCRERGLNCLDLNGRVWLRTKGLLVDRQASPPIRVRPAQAHPDVFSLKSSRLPRTLLNHPGRRWSQKELVERTGLSPGLVSRLTRHLVNEGLLASKGRTLFVEKPDALLDAWAARDDWTRRTTLRQYSLLHADLNEVARKIQTLFPPGRALVFTQWFAANLRRPYTTPPVVSAYVPAFDDKRIERELGGRRVADGGTLWLIVPGDEGVFRETQLADGLALVCDAQIYLDLLHAGWRGSEQAQALREWKDFGKAPA